MHSTVRNQWIGTVILVGVVYAVVGVATAKLAGSASSPQMRTTWRMAAWLLSLVTFVGHVVREQLVLRRAVRSVAAHAAAAVALGAFAIAALGPVRSHWGAADFWRASALSLALWPVLTGLPAFLAALVFGLLLRRFLNGKRGESRPKTSAE